MMKTIDDIKKIIEAYFAGETSLEQEDALRNYFTNNDAPNELKKYQAIFGYFNRERIAPQSKEINNDIALQAIEPKQKNRRIMWYSIASIAACVAFLITIMINSNKQQNQSTEIICEGTFVIIDGKCTNDPELVSKLAINAIDAIIMPTNDAALGINTILGDNNQTLNRHTQVLGQSTTSSISKIFDDNTNTINKHTQLLKQLEQAY